jgi:hypothetical protein
MRSYRKLFEELVEETDSDLVDTRAEDGTPEEVGRR